ncbi:MAG: hypothetical protein ABJA82_04010 [Myxococcales bacterium]
MSLLSGPAWSARVEVLATNSSHLVGEVHVIAGGVSEAIFEGRSTHDALDKLRAVKGARFRVEPRLPNPSDGDLTFPGPEQGKLEERPLAHLMRYCEDYVLTATIEVWRGSENAKVSYRRGEIVGVTVGGIDAPERLGEVMKWASGSYRLIVPKLTLPETAPKTAAPAAVVAPRSTGAASKTIFGMPALDPVAIAAATDKVKAVQAQLQAAKAAATAATAVPASAAPAPQVPGPSSSAVGPRRGAIADPTPAISPPTQPTPPAPGAPHQSGAMAKTIFGVQPPAPAPGATTSAPAATAAKAVPATAASANPTAPRAEAAAKPARTTGPHAPAARVQSTEPVVPAASADSDRTQPSKKSKDEKSAETPVWTYVGVGFVFGLALLGVYRLVIVLAH